MRWGKMILVIQAMITLLVGVILLIQMMGVEKSSLSDLVESATDEDYNSSGIEKDTVTDYKSRFHKVIYILIVVALIEWILITRLMN